MDIPSFRAFGKPGAMEELYKNPGHGVIIGVILCFSIATEFIIQGEYQLGDAISTALVFLSGILFIMSGIVMIREVKEGTEQADIDT